MQLSSPDTSVQPLPRHLRQSAGSGHPRTAQDDSESSTEPADGEASDAALGAGHTALGAGLPTPPQVSQTSVSSPKEVDHV
jgi:hypothetical protein